ncbi:MAG: hypothetical protein KF851_08265 [Pirellulaceae bacterium]|nr:hypothetical protein [Pirellulaceae bacterium]
MAGFDYGALEPRLVLDAAAQGDGTPPTIYDLDPKVGAAVVQALQNVQGAAQSGWRPATGQTFNNSDDWRNASQFSYKEDHQWNEHIVDMGAPNGLTVSTTLTAEPVDGGGHLIFYRVHTTNRTAGNIPGSGGPSMGGGLEGGGGTYNGLSETVSTQQSVYIAYTSNEQDAQSIVSSGLFDPSAFDSYFQINLGHEFEFLELPPQPGQTRKFSVQTSYTYDFALFWSTNSTTTENDITTHIAYDLLVTAHAEGNYSYQAHVISTQGTLAEVYSISGSSLATSNQLSKNYISMFYNEGDLYGSGFGGVASATLSRDFHYVTSTTSTTLGSGIRYASTGNSQGSLGRQITGSYTIANNPDFTLSYSGRYDLTPSLTNDIGEAGSGLIYSGGTSFGVNTLVASGSGFAESEGRMWGYGTFGLQISINTFAAGNVEESVLGDSFAYFDSSGSNQASAWNYKLEGNGPAHYFIRSMWGGGSGSVSAITVVETIIVLDRDKVHAQVPGVLSGSVVSLGTQPLLQFDSSGFSGYDFRAVSGSISTANPFASNSSGGGGSGSGGSGGSGGGGSTSGGGEGGESFNLEPAELNADAMLYLELYTPTGLSETVSFSSINGNLPGAQAGKDFSFVWHAGKSSSQTNHNNSGDIIFNSSMKFVPDAKPTFSSNGNSAMDFQSSSNFSASSKIAQQISDYAGQSGGVFLSQSDSRGSSASHGDYGGNYNLSIQERDVPATSNTPTVNSVGEITASAPWLIDTHLVIGNQSSYFNETIDSANYVDRVRNTSEVHFFQDPNNFLISSEEVDFEENENVTSGSTQESSSDSFASGSQETETEDNSEQSSEIAGNGTVRRTVESKLEGAVDPESPEGISVGSGNASGLNYFKYHLVETLTSEGNNSESLNRNEKQKSTNEFAEDEGEGGEGSGNGGNGSAWSDGDEPVYEHEDGDRKIALKGGGEKVKEKVYQVESTVNQFLLKMVAEAVGVGDGVSDPIRYESDFNLKKHGTDTNRTTHRVEDSTTQSFGVEPDGIVQTTNGELKIFETNLIKLRNDEPIIRGDYFTNVPGQIDQVVTTIEPHDFKVDGNSTLTTTIAYDGFGIKTKLINDTEVDGDGNNILLPTRAESQGVGKVTITEQDQGLKTTDIKAQRVKEQSWPTTYLKHTHNVESVSKSDWDLIDRFITEYYSEGGHEMVYEPRGQSTWTNTLKTNGNANWWHEVPDPLNQSVIYRSGSMSYYSRPNAGYEGGPSEFLGQNSDNDGVSLKSVTSRDGSIRQVFDSSGNLSNANGEIKIRIDAGGSSYANYYGQGYSWKGSPAVIKATRTISEMIRGDFEGSREVVLTGSAVNGELVLNHTDSGLEGSKRGERITSDRWKKVQYNNASVSLIDNAFVTIDNGTSQPATGGSATVLFDSNVVYTVSDNGPLEMSGHFGFFATAYGFEGGTVFAGFIRPEIHVELDDGAHNLDGEGNVISHPGGLDIDITANPNLFGAVGEFFNIELNLTNTGAFLKGVGEGFFVDGAGGMVEGLWGMLNGFASYVSFAAQYYTTDLEELMANNAMAQSIDAAGAMLAEAKPYVDAVLKDLPILTGGPGELSPETQEIMTLLAEVLPQLLSDLKEGMLGMKDNKRAELIGKVMGAVLFEAALAVGTGGAAALAIAGKLGKLETIPTSFKFPGSDQIVKKFHNAIGAFLKRKQNARKHSVGEGSDGELLRIRTAGVTSELETYNARKIGAAIADDPVAYRSYMQTRNRVGADMVLDFGVPPVDAAGRVRRIDAIEIFVRNNPTVRDAVSTFVHESRHISDLDRGIVNLLRPTVRDEYRAFRREFLFNHGRRPDSMERLNLWLRVRELYPYLPLE